MAYYNPYNRRDYHPLHFANNRAILCSLLILASDASNSFPTIGTSKFWGLNESLEQQGIVGEATLSCTYISTNVHAAWCFLQGMNVADEEFALDAGLRMAACVHRRS